MKTSRLEEARKVYREALEAARADPNPDAWVRLLAAGKELSQAENPQLNRSVRRGRKSAPTLAEIEGSDLLGSVDSAALRGAPFGE